MTRWWRTIVAVALGCALLVTAAAFALRYAQEERRQAIEGWRARLTAMADDRAAAVAQWVAHGRGDARALADRRVIIERLTARDSGDRAPVGGGPAAQPVQAALDAFVRTQGYRSAYLVTEAGTLLAASAGSLPFDNACLSAARRVLAGGEGTPEFCLRSNGSPLVTFAAPVSGDNAAQLDAARPAIGGAVVLESDPHASLYPILAREPTYTATGETVLFGREGTDIVFLNPPRRAGARPIGLRVRSGSSTLAALKTSGGVYARVDTRGVPVFAATSPVVGAPWSVVVKVEESEVLAPYRRELRTNALALSGFLLLLAGAGFGLWRERRFAYEKAIARGKARLSLVLEHANDAIIFSSLDGRILEANPRACEFHGYTREELLQLDDDALHPPETAPEVREWVANARLQDGIVGEHLHRRKDGSTFPVEASVRMVEIGSRRFYLAIVRDISERKHAQERYRRLVETAPDVVFSISAAGLTITALNPAFEKITGWSREEWIGKPFAPLIHPDDLDLAEQTSRQTFSGICPSPYELRVLSKSGEYMVGEFTSVPEIENGVVVGEFGIVRDITERKRVEEALRYRFEIERLVAGISTELIAVEPAAMDAAIANALAAIGELARADRSYLFQFSLDGARHSNTHEWCGAGVEPQMPMLQDLGSEDFPWIIPRLRKFETVHVPRVVALPPEASSERAVLEAGGVRSIVVIPVSRGNSIFGFLGFDSVREEKTWAEEDITLLKLVGEAIANALNRQRAEESLRRSEERLRTVVETATDAIVTADGHGTIVAWNRAAEEMFGYSPEEAVGKNLTLVMPARFHEPHHRAMQRLLSTGVPTLVGKTVELAGQASDGREFPVEASIGSWNSAGQRYFTAILRDVSERERAERQIRMLAHSLKSIGECVSITDHDNRILFVNEAFLKTYAYTEEELIGQPFPILLPPGEATARAEEILGATLASGWRGEIINRRKDGSEFPVFLSTSVVRDDAGSPIALVGVATDLTERKRLEEQFARAQRMETVGALAGGMAHDFNNLMQAVLNHTQLLLARPHEPDQVRAWAREIQERVAHGASITRQLLIFSRREVVKPERLDLNDVVRSTAGLLHHLIRENVTVRLDLVSSPLPIEADRGQLEQAVMNLAVNASEAMPAGGRLTFVTGLAENGDVQLVVRDTGRGIPEEIRDRIFEPFFSTKHASEGAGLGLAVVHGIVSKQGGRIEVESEVGKGTTFRITLPRKVCSQFVAVPETVLAPQGLAEEGHGERVLLVEDEEAAREGLAEMLSTLGYMVVAVESGEEAQALPAQPPFHLLLTDLLLPGVSGAELAQALVARWRDLKVIVMSGYAEDEAVRRGSAAGTLRFLQKPFDMETLADELRAVLAER